MLAYDQPINQAETRRRAGAAAAGRELQRDRADRACCGGARSRSWRPALICACAAVMIGKSLTPRYAATAQLYVDPRELQLVDRELTPRSQDISGLSMVVESQARLITSNNVLLQVIEDTKLDKDPEFGGDDQEPDGNAARTCSGSARDPPVEAKLGQMARAGRPEPPHQRQEDRPHLHRRYRSLVDTTRRRPRCSPTPISAAYLAESKQSQADAARRATTDLSGRLKELQERLRNAENALAVYKAQNNFVGTQDTLISDQQLSASNQRLAAARALTLDAQAKYDQIEASRRASTDAGAIPEALQSPTIANLRAQYAEAPQALCRTDRANSDRCIRRCGRWRSRSRTCAAPSTRKSTASRSRPRTT